MDERRDHAVVDYRAEYEDGHAADALDDEAEAEGADGVAHAVRNHHQAHPVDAPGARHVGLAEHKETTVRAGGELNG